jgi:hypothetical protein
MLYPEIKQPINLFIEKNFITRIKVSTNKSRCLVIETIAGPTLVIGKEIDAKNIAEQSKDKEVGTKNLSISA